MLPSKERLSRTQFNSFLSKKEVKVVYNRLGTLKYILKEKGFSVVTGSKAEKKAVSRNKLRRRIYCLFKKEHPSLSGILYASKQSYQMSFGEIAELFHDLITKSKKNTH